MFQSLICKLTGKHIWSHWTATALVNRHFTQRYRMCGRCSLKEVLHVPVIADGVTSLYEKYGGTHPEPIEIVVETGGQPAIGEAIKIAATPMPGQAPYFVERPEEGNPCDGPEDKG